jgi:Spy/CpxP family protein refolding chaperone
MKLNKTMMLVALVAGGLLSGIPLRAQDASNTPAATPPPTRRPMMTVDGIAKQLDLTDDQKTKVKPIIEDMQKQGAEVRKDTSLSQEDRRAKMKEIRDAASTQLKDILTPEQFAKWQKMGAGNRRQAPPNAPPGGAPATPPQN